MEWLIKWQAKGTSTIEADTAEEAQEIWDGLEFNHLQEGLINVERVGIEEVWLLRYVPGSLYNLILEEMKRR